MSNSAMKTIENDTAICPVCGEYKDVILLNKMYADLLNGVYVQEVQQYSNNQLTRFVSPPAIAKNGKPSSIHPGVLAFILLVIFAYLFANQLAEKGQYTIVYGLGIGVLIIAYWLLRRRLMAKYNQNKHDREKLISELREKADIWMEMVYCIKDDLVFTPDHKIQLKLEQLRDYWLKQTRDQG